MKHKEDISHLITPMGNRVVVLEDSPEAVTGSGIIIPVGYRETSVTGLVVAVGNSTLLLNVGDRVLYGKHTMELPDFEGLPKDGRIYRILREEPDIFLVLGETDEVSRFSKQIRMDFDTDVNSTPPAMEDAVADVLTPEPTPRFLSKEDFKGYVKIGRLEVEDVAVVTLDEDNNVVNEPRPQHPFNLDDLEGDDE